ncbi:unnamed protein product, partial [Durusdinium trenchii]
RRVTVFFPYADQFIEETPVSIALVKPMGCTTSKLHLAEVGQESWSSWDLRCATSMPSPPTRRSHDKHVQIMTTFVKAVDRSPQRFAKMIHRQREAAGMHDSDNEIEVSVSV